VLIIAPGSFVSASRGLAQAASATAEAPELSGVFQAIPQDTILPTGLRNSGSPGEISLQLEAIKQSKNVDLKEDPARLCLPVGPFRMMARDRAKIELVSEPKMIMMFFEDISHGNIRTIHLDRPHPDKVDPSWLGDSVGVWNKGTLVVDTTGFNDRTWLNDSGVQHSPNLRLIERIRPVLQGRFLEFKITAEDPQALTRPYTYVRYFEKLRTEIMEDVCEVEE
jgi:hypothetical protein